MRCQAAKLLSGALATDAHPCARMQSVTTSHQVVTQPIAKQLAGRRAWQLWNEVHGQMGPSCEACSSCHQLGVGRAGCRC